ncbi:MAG TPA: four helix bundle protein [Candidatus Acidoferrum sp.]|jgi:four helix bundle protein|nr:four helix bundle protein [Candidatus Acidoferrum sp.]
MGTQLEYVRHFKELEVYKKQRALSREVFRLSKGFPTEEKYSLTDQLRRASRSIGAQIAEAWAKRLYPKHFVSKLTDADGEQMESQHWLIEAKDCDYLDLADSQRLLGWCEEIGRMLGSMIRKAETFSSTDYSLHEEPPPYLTSDALNTDY